MAKNKAVHVEIMASVKGFIRKTKMAGCAVATFATKARKHLRTVVVGFAQMTAAVTAFVGVFAAVIGKTSMAFASLEKKATEVGTLLKKWGKDTFESIISEAQRLAIAFGQTTDAMLGAKYDIVSAGFTNVSESTTVLTASLKAATAGLVDAKTAAGLIISGLRGYQLAAKDATTVSDIFFTTVRLGRTTFVELAQSLPVVIPMAKAAGASLKQLGAAMAAITLGGIDTRMAAVSLNRLFLSMAAPASEAAKAMARLGIVVTDTKGKMLPLIAVVKQFRGKSLAQIKEIAGDVRSARALMALAQNYKQYSAILKEFGSTAGATEEAFKKMSQTLSFKAAQLGAAFTAIWQDIGKATSGTMGKTIEDLLAELQAAREYIKKNAEEIGQVLGDMIRDGVAFAKDAVKWLITNWASIVDWAKRLLVVFLAIKSAQIGMAISKIVVASATLAIKLKVATVAAAALGIALKAVNLSMALLGKLVPPVAAAWAGWNFGKWLGEIELVKNALDSVLAKLDLFGRGAEERKLAASMAVPGEAVSRQKGRMTEWRGVRGAASGLGATKAEIAAVAKAWQTAGGIRTGTIAENAKRWLEAVRADAKVLGEVSKQASKNRAAHVAQETKKNVAAFKAGLKKRIVAALDADKKERALTERQSAEREVVIAKEKVGIIARELATINAEASVTQSDARAVTLGARGKALKASLEKAETVLFKAESEKRIAIANEVADAKKKAEDKARKATEKSLRAQEKATRAQDRAQNKAMAAYKAGLRKNVSAVRDAVRAFKDRLKEEVDALKDQQKKLLQEQKDYQKKAADLRAEAANIETDPEALRRQGKLGRQVQVKKKGAFGFGKMEWSGVMDAEKKKKALLKSAADADKRAEGAGNRVAEIQARVDALNTTAADKVAAALAAIGQKASTAKKSIKGLVAQMVVATAAFNRFAKMNPAAIIASRATAKQTTAKKSQAGVAAGLGLGGAAALVPGGGALSVVLNVAGSVVSEENLITNIAKGLERRAQQGSFNPKARS